MLRDPADRRRGRLTAQPGGSAGTRKVIRSAVAAPWSALRTAGGSGGTAGPLYARVSERKRNEKREPSAEGQVAVCRARLADLGLGQGKVLIDESEYHLRTANGKKGFRDAINAAAYYSGRLSTRSGRSKKLKALAGEPNGSARPFGFEADLITVREDEAARLGDQDQLGRVPVQIGVICAGGGWPSTAAISRARETVPGAGRRSAFPRLVPGPGRTAR